MIWSATPAWLMALTESPPPMIEVAVSIRRHGLGNRVGAHRKARKLKDARRPVPHNGLRRRNHVLDRRNRLRPDVEPLPVVGKIDRAVPHLRLGVGGKLVGQNVVHRQQQLHALGLRLVQRLLRQVDLVFFHQRLARR